MIHRAGWDWLEGAVIAGYVPHFEGIELALRATHASWLAEITDAEAQGVFGDALGWASHADAYRQLSARLERFAGEMELRAAEIHRRDEEGAGQRLRRMAAEDAREAEIRAEHALQRARSAEDDNASAERLRRRYAAREEERA